MYHKAAAAMHLRAGLPRLRTAALGQSKDWRNGGRRRQVVRMTGKVEIPSNTKTVYHVQDLAFKSWFYHDAVSGVR